MTTRPVWAEISKRNLIANYRALCALATPNADLLAVVKANAYGHGVLDCGTQLVEAGAEWLGVTCVEEAVEIRAACPQARILVMSGVWRGEADAVLKHTLTPVIWEQFHLDLLEAAALRVGLGPQSVPVFLEIDTGMSRQGVRVTLPHSAGDGNAELSKILGRFHTGSPLRLEGIMTHFSAPEVLDDSATDSQIEAFKEALLVTRSLGLTPRWVSAGNSATLIAGKDLPILKAVADSIGSRLLLRPGLALYGYPPRFTGDVAEISGYQPVLAWKSRVTSLRTIKPGETAGYNSTFRAHRPTRLALLPCGYADGVSRLLSNRGSVLIRGQRAPIAGRVSMDQTIIDVTDVTGIEIGDEVVLIGTQGDHSITAYDIADQMGTIPYEVLCSISHRVLRILVD
ncbi:MAG TPA: alanine racemase [Acidisarcina sp.]